MSFESGTAPRRLLQTHGAFINAVLAPNLKQKRHWSTNAKLHTDETKGTQAEQSHAKRLNVNMEFVSNDEVFDAREGEILVNSLTESGFPAHRRGALFSSLNGFRVQQTGGSTEPHEAVLQQSDLRFVGLCQNAYVSSNTALSEQGMAVQVSGIKTIINDSEETINIGDKLMVDTMKKVPSKVRKGIPNEKVRLVLRKVPQGFVPQTAMKEAVDKIIDAMNSGTYSGKYGPRVVDATSGKVKEPETRAAIKEIAALVITEFRKAGHWVVGVAENSARHGEQVDVLLTKPSFL
jgi:hypothetical protein